MDRGVITLLCLFILLFTFLHTFNCKAGDLSCCGYEMPEGISESDFTFRCTTHSNGIDHGNCTWWCYYKAPEISPTSGNANTWYSWAQSEERSRGDFPIPGSIAVFENLGDLGHVAYVESTRYDGRFNVTEMGYNWIPCMQTNQYNTNEATGFIYPLAPQNNTLVRIQGQDPVYWLQNGKAYHILNGELVDLMADGLPGWWGRNKILDYPEDILTFGSGSSSFTQGPDFIGTGTSSNGLLIKRIDDPNVYIIEDGRKKWITSTQVFEELGYDWNDVITVTEAIFNQIPEGEPIYSGYGNWIKTYHGNNPWTWGHSIIRTSDNKLLIVGELTHNIGQEEGALLMKLDKTGKVEFSKRYADSNSYEFDCALEDDGQNFIVAGSGYCRYSTTNGLIVKVDHSGNLLWDEGKFYPDMRSIRCIKKASDGSYFLYGRLSNGTFVAKLNSDFEVLWQRNISQGSHQRVANPMQLTNDGGVICAVGNDNDAPWILRLSSNGALLWQKRYRHDYNFADSRSITQTSDGNFVICGLLHKYYGVNSSAFFIFKIDKDGMLYWPDAKLFDDEDNEWASAIIELDNGDLLVAGPDYSDSASNGKILVTKMNSNGESIWKKTYGYGNPSGNDIVFNLKKIENNFYILGNHRPNVEEDVYRNDLLIMKLSNSGLVGESSDFINNAMINEESVNLIPESSNETITEIPPYQFINSEIVTYDTKIDALPICQGSSLHDQTISQLPFGLVPELTIFDAINFSSSLTYGQLYLGIRALHNLILNWSGSELKLEVFKPDGTLYGEYQDTTPPISVDIPNPEEGLWTYNVTALDIPHNEYPFSIVVGITKFQGDFNSDGDVDGSDLAKLVNSEGLSIETFAENFGNVIQN